jgi:Periplasmic copper-binding protein (NosD)
MDNLNLLSAPPYSPEANMLRTHTIPLLLASAIAFATTHTHAAPRTFVASYGADANTSVNCSLALPCRGFAAAQTVTDNSGEIVVLDSAGYGGLTITKSISILAPAGVYAGIAVPSGAIGVTITAPESDVVLRGLSINGQGGNYGIYMTSGNSLSVENCVISNFALSIGAGVYSNASAKVSVLDTTFRKNFNGINIEGGGSTLVSRSTLLGLSGGKGIYIHQTVSQNGPTATIADSTVSGSYLGIQASSDGASSVVRVSIMRSTITKSGYGIVADAISTGYSLVTVSQSLITENVFGFVKDGTNATIKTLGNNTVDSNGTNADGAITSLVNDMDR